MAKILNQAYNATSESYFKRCDSIISKAFEEGIITQRDAEILVKYKNRLTSNVSPERVALTTSVLITARRYFPDEFDEVDDDEFETAMGLLTYAKWPEKSRREGKPYSRNYIVTLKAVTKKFYMWLSSKGMTNVSEKTIKDAKIGRYDMFTKTEDDVITVEELNNLLRVIRHPMYKAYYSLLYETGARSIELANLKWGDITFKEWGLQIHITDTKTDKMRAVPCIAYKQYLIDWFNQYPGGNPGGKKFVFISQNGNPIKYTTVKAYLERAVKRSGIQKKISLHRFRHSRITHMLRNGMSETVAKKAFWGNLDSHMLATYGHLTNTDVENECMKLAGIEIPPNQEEELPKSITCPQCLTANPPGTLRCTVCGEALSEKIKEQAKKDEEAISVMFEHLSMEEKIGFIENFEKLLHQSFEKEA